MEVATAVQGVIDEDLVSAVEDVLRACDVSTVKDVLPAHNFAADPLAVTGVKDIISEDPVSSVEVILRDPAADGVEDEISDSGADSSRFRLLLALSVAADLNPTVSGERNISSSTAIPQPITVKQTRKKRRGISKRKDGRSGKVTQNRDLPPTKQTKIISPAKQTNNHKMSSLTNKHNMST